MTADFFLCCLIHELPQHGMKTQVVVTAMVTRGYLQNFIFAFHTKPFVLFMIQRVAAVITDGKQ